MVKTVRSSLAGQVNVFETDVRLHVALKETAKAGRTILDYDSSSPSAQAYRHLAGEVLQVCGDEATVALPEPAPASAASLLDLPLLVAPEPEPEHTLLVARQPRAAAPAFESFIVEEWQRLLGASN